MLDRALLLCVILMACEPPPPSDPPIGGDTGPVVEFEVEDSSHVPSSGSNLHVLDMGTHYFALWNRSHSIVGARVSYDGELLDPGGISLVDRESEDRFDLISSVVFDGSEIVVSIEWGFIDSPVTGTSLALFDRDGRALDGPIHSVDSAAFDGTHVVLTWRDPEGRLWARTMTPGTLALGTEHPISTSGAVSPVSIAVHAGTVMLSWREAGRIMTSVLASDASPLVPGGVEVVDSVGDAADWDANHTLHATSTGFAMLHTHRDAVTERRLLHATFFDAAGVAIAEPPLALYDPLGTASTSGASAASLGSDWLVVAVGDTQSQGYVIDTATRTVTSGPVALADTEESEARLECYAAECIVAVQTSSDYPSSIRADRYGPRFERTGSFEPSVVAPSQSRGRAAFDGTQYAIMWEQGDEFRVRRLSREGRWLDANPIVIPRDLNGGNATWIEGYADGGFLVGWTDSDADVGADAYYVRRMNADGSWAWPTVPVFTRAGALWVAGQRAACAAETCLVVGASSRESQFVVIGGDGTELARSAALRGNPIIPAFDGMETFWLAFTDSYSDRTLNVLAIAAAGPSAGETVGSFDVEPPPDSNIWPHSWHRSGAELLLLAGTAGSHLETRTVTLAGGVSEPTFTVVVGGFVGAFGGEQLEIVSQSGLGADESQLFVTRAAAAVPLFDARTYQTLPSVIGDGDRALLVITRRDLDVGFGATRVRAAFLGNRSSLLSDDAACVDDGECAGARCRDLFCCDECPLFKGF